MKARELLEQLLPDEMIVEALWDYVEETDAVTVNIEDVPVRISREDPMPVVARSCAIGLGGVDVGFPMRGIVAVGGVSAMRDGVPETTGCFVCIWFDEDRKLITADFEREWIW